MAPDRGSGDNSAVAQRERWAALSDAEEDHDTDMSMAYEESAALMGGENATAPADDEEQVCPQAAGTAEPGFSFTARGVLAGLLVGLVICFSNMYFGLQTGWVSSMTMPASLMGFGLFKTLSRRLSFPFSPVENVLVQTVAGSMAIMPLGCGFVGVIPAMNYLLKPEEGGPLFLSLGQLVIWSLGLCYFGVVFAVPLRRQVIIRERLKFPSGFSTAVLIGVLHNKPSVTLPRRTGASLQPTTSQTGDIEQENRAETPTSISSLLSSATAAPPAAPSSASWKANVRLLLACFLASGILTVATYFIPALRSLPVFGSVAAKMWLWTFNPSLAYVGQGIIMGPATTLHMLLGALVGWGILSPLAKARGWAPGKIDDWNRGSQGWIVWVSLAIMLADAVVSLAHVAYGAVARPRRKQDTAGDEDNGHEADAPREQLIGNKTVAIGLALSIAFCVLCTHLVFGHLVPLLANVAAVFLALVLSVMGVRALGETDLNPVSGISKLAQLFFALITPQNSKSSVLVNLVAGAVSEAGALQAGDMMQDLKTGHLVGAAPNAQFWGQVIGATVGAVASAMIYRLYTAVYEIPGSLFQVPTGYVWIFTARLVTGKGLPPMAEAWAVGAAVLFAIFTVLRIWQAGKPWQCLIPGGIAVAVGMYNVPSFTLARAVGGLLGWYWRSRLRWEETPIIVLASGFILGEGTLSIANLLMQTFGVPHL